MLRSRSRSRTVLTVLLILAGASVAFAGDAEKKAGEEIKWGYKAARRGYWQEALMRFERADQLTPNRPHVLNNLAIACEALGRYDDARQIYERALELAPHDQALRRNHARFVEFYREYVAPPEPKEGTAPPPEAEPPPQTPAPGVEEGGDGDQG